MTILPLSISISLAPSGRSVSLSLPLIESQIHFLSFQNINSCVHLLSFITQQQYPQFKDSTTPANPCLTMHLLRFSHFPFLHLNDNNPTLTRGVDNRISECFPSQTCISLSNHCRNTVMLLSYSL